MMILFVYVILDFLGNFVVRFIFVKYFFVLYFLFVKKVMMGICVSVYLDWEEIIVIVLIIV